MEPLKQDVKGFHQGGVLTLVTGSSFGSSVMSERGSGSAAVVESSNSHFWLWCAAVEDLQAYLILIEEPKQSTTVRVLASVWRPLPTYRLRQIRCHIHCLP